MPREYLRGQIYYASLDPVIGHEQAGRRPVLIIQIVLRHNAHYPSVSTNSPATGNLAGTAGVEKCLAKSIIVTPTILLV